MRTIISTFCPRVGGLPDDGDREAKGMERARSDSSEEESSDRQKGNRSEISTLPTVTPIIGVTPVTNLS